MSSPSCLYFISDIKRSDNLILVASTIKEKSKIKIKESILQAALSMQVSALENYFKKVISDYLGICYECDVDSLALHYNDLLLKRLSEYKKRVNSINSEKARDLLINFSGFDPWSDWVFIKFGSEILQNTIHVRNRLDEVVDIRHAFAHGVPMKEYSWIKHKSMLTCADLRATNKFLCTLVEKTDRGFSRYIRENHPQLGFNW